MLIARRLRWLLGNAWLVPVFAAGRLDRVELKRFRLRHRAGRAVAPSAASSHAEISEAISAGLGFLERTQRPHGLWRGFMLAPGASTEWISAHVALLLEDLPEARGMNERVARRLLANAQQRPGWGYNRRVGIDSDSSAQTIMVLQRHGHEVSSAWVDRLLAAQHEEGGFATYSPPSGGQARTWWERPHADVALFAVAALRRIDRHEEERRKALAWLSTQVVDDVLPAYWWTDPAYSLWAQARTGFQIAASAQLANARLATEDRPVYLAMLISAALADAPWSSRLAAATSRLLRERREDGSWPCALCLRNTHASHAGGLDAPGPVYSDPYRVFSTAHAVAAMSFARDALAAAA